MSNNLKYLLQEQIDRVLYVIISVELFEEILTLYDDLRQAEIDQITGKFQDVNKLLIRITMNQTRLLSFRLFSLQILRSGV